MKVGFLGLGGMGVVMVICLVQVGFEVMVWNCFVVVCEFLVVLGVVRVEEVGELFGFDVVISMLVDDQVICGVLFDSGVFEWVRLGFIYLSMLILLFDCVEVFDQVYQCQGFVFVVVLVFGCIDVVEVGKLNIVVGGLEEVIE